MSDARLDRLVTHALSRNASVRVRLARVRLAQGRETDAMLARLPQVSLRAAGGFQRNIASFGGVQTTDVAVSLPVSYELDVFSRWADAHRASEFDVEASRLDTEVAVLSTSAELSEAYFLMVATERERQLRARLLEVEQAYASLLERRVEGGVDAPTELRAEQIRLATLEGQLRNDTTRLALRRLEIATLLGLTDVRDLPDELAAPDGALPDVPPLSAARVTADTLQNRPDVRAAARRLMAVDRRVQSALAARLPSIQLDVEPGYTVQHNELSGAGSAFAADPLAHGFTFRARATINVPLLEPLVRIDRPDAERAQLDVEAALFEELLVSALLETERALLSEREERQTWEAALAQHALAQQVVEEESRRFSGGLVDRRQLLVAERQALDTQLLEVAAHRRMLSRRIQVHRALGGSWATERGPRCGRTEVAS